MAFAGDIVDSPTTNTNTTSPSPLSCYFSVSFSCSLRPLLFYPLFFIPLLNCTYRNVRLFVFFLPRPLIIISTLPARLPSSSSLFLHFLFPGFLFLFLSFCFLFCFSSCFLLFVFLFLLYPLMAFDGSFHLFSYVLLRFFSSPPFQILTL